MAGYSTNADVKKYISLCALPALTTGDPTELATDDAQLEFARECATEDIDSYILGQYDLESAHAVKPKWLVHTEAIFICVWIFRHSTNGAVPPGLQTFYDERIEALQQIKMAQRQIPGLAVRSDPGVSMSNLTHDQRWSGTHKIRTSIYENTGDQRSVVARNYDYNRPPE